MSSRASGDRMTRSQYALPVAITLVTLGALLTAEGLSPGRPAAESSPDGAAAKEPGTGLVSSGDSATVRSAPTAEPFTIAPGKDAREVRIPYSPTILLLGPGSRVDVLLVTKELTGRRSRVARVILTNLRVVGVGRPIRLEGGERTVSVTLEVTPAEGERLLTAEVEGPLEVALRGAGDHDSPATRGASSDDLMSELQRRR